MKNRFKEVFATKKPVIAMVHLGALPGSPLHDSEAGLNGLIEAARLDLHALQDAQVDAVMFGNENDRPYELVNPGGGRNVKRNKSFIEC